MSINKIISQVIAVFAIFATFAVSGWSQYVYLTLTLTDAPDPVNAGAQLTYTVNVANSNANKADDVIVTIPLPAGTSYVSGCGLSGSNVSCDFGTISKNSNETLSFIVNAPSSAGSISATATVATSDNNQNGTKSQTATTTVISIPEINVLGNGVTITDGDSTPSTTDGTDFGSTAVSGGTVDKTFTVQNTGTAALTLGTVSVGGTNNSDFNVTAQPAATVSAGGTTTFTVRFDPSAIGTRSATLSFSNNDSNENPYNFSIQGTGTIPTLSIAPTTQSTMEGDSGTTNAIYTVTLSSSSSSSITVDYVVVGSGVNPATADVDFNATISGPLTFMAGETSKTIIVPIFGDTVSEPDETYTVILSNPVNATVQVSTAIGTIIDDDNYCDSHGLATGFHIIDPDGGDSSNSFEIFCSDDSPKKVLIALPNKNTSNNFLFNTNTLSSTNYYTQAISNSTQFQAIEIDPVSMQVITSGTLNPTVSGYGYNVLGKGFSNINLMGTPFVIDWSHTTISGCDTSKLTRKGYYGQVVKINTLDYNNQARCQIDSMKLKLLDDYTYLTYNGGEVLEKTCKEMAESVPTDVLDSTTVKGHYWISPLQHNRSYNSTDLTALDRPIVAYCWYQTDLDYVWTFFLAMDGKVTTTKNDLINKNDTCSEKGLWPFVPNSEATFERVRKFLDDKKSEWINYTGTIQEKVSSLYAGNNYYLSTERPSPLWPYGSFGVYFPYNGNHDAAGSYQKWGGTSTNQTGWMSGSPMHNIQAITEDYSRKNDDTNGGATPITTRDYYSWGNYSSTDSIGTPTSSYTYADTMGAKGWRSVLADLGKTDQWFISRSGAGDNFDRTSNYPYYEPNGNYTAGAWLNFLFDDQGRVRHNDDWDANYPYYDYMCMAEDNYDFAVRYSLVKGPFNVIEHDDVLSGSEYKDANLTTKIVNDSMRFDVVLLKNDLSDIRDLETDGNLSAGIFLNDTYYEGTTETARSLWYFGEISDFDGNRFEIPASKWPSGVQTWPKADKRLFFEFKYCANDNLAWTDCWDHTGTSAVATCKSGYSNICKTADSNDFAARPDHFGFVLSTGKSPLLLKSGEAEDVEMHAYRYGDYTDTPDYNQTNTKLIITVTKMMPNNVDENASLHGDATFASSFNFVDGLNDTNASLSYSDVGNIRIRILDEDWASVDATDTPATDRVIWGENTFRFIPYQFMLANIRIVDSQDGNFTYLSNDLNMSAKLDLDITARNKQNSLTQNFHEGLYENPVEVIPTIVDTVRGTATTTNIASTLLGFTSGLKHVGWDDTNVSRLLRFNFTRDASVSVNPFEVNATEVNISVESVYADTTLSMNETIENNTTNKDGATNGTTGNAVMLYGRANAPDYRFSRNPGCGRIFFEFYDTNSADSLIMTTFGAMPPASETSDKYWYQNTQHNIATDGNVTSLAATAVTVYAYGTNPGGACIGSLSGGGFEKRVFLYDASFGYPYRTNTQLDATDWLDVTGNEFGLEFYKSSNWVGTQNKSKTATDSDAETISNRRIMW